MQQPFYHINKTERGRAEVSMQKGKQSTRNSVLQLSQICQFIKNVGGKSGDVVEV